MSHLPLTGIVGAGGAGPSVPTIMGWSVGNSGGVQVASIDVSVPAELEADDLLVCLISVDRSNAGLTPVPSGFTDIGEEHAFDCGVRAAYKYATGEESTVTVGAPGGFASCRIIGWLLAIRGTASLSPIETSAIFNQNGGGIPVGPFDVGPVTTTADDCLVIAHMAHDGSDGHPFSVTNAGWTSGDSEGTEGGSANGASGAWVHKLLETAGGSGAADFQGGSNDGNAGLCFAIKPA